jgi:hypothetical protein
MRKLCLRCLAALFLTCVIPGHVVKAGSVRLTVDTPMSPPGWALMERELIRAQEALCLQFFDKYFDERGYLECVERWGGDDGPDDAIECVADWPILHALGADDSVLTLYKKAWEGHLRQYTEAKTVEVPLARDGMFYKEFHTMFDWMHLGEELRVFNLQGLSDPNDRSLHQRARRFAGFYMNEDPGAPNYDPKHRIIRSLFNGSRGPLMRKATGLDWAGDPIEVAHRFDLGHGEKSYEQMVFHFKDYNDIVGGHPQNLSATTLGLNGYLLTGESKYREWLLDYVNAWVERTEENGGVTPSNIGLDGTIGGETDGKWYGGVYGWGFSVEVPGSGKMAHRPRVYRAIVGFGNAFLLTGDQRYVTTWTRMIDQINKNSKMIDGVTHYPRMFGDEGWYDYQKSPWNYGTLECWFWTGSEKNRQRVAENSWVKYLSGENPDYPVQALQRDFGALRSKAERMRNDTTTPDTRLADDPMDKNPATVRALSELMMAGLDPGRGGGPLHARLRYFDPIRRRAGVPDDIAALVDQVGKDSVSVTLVNINQSRAREFVVQCGAYAENEISIVSLDGVEVAVNGPSFHIKIEPGCGARLTLNHSLYSRQPTLHFPWDQR